MQYVAQYNSYYVRRSYLLFSDAFKNKPYYIVEAEATNYLHLLGVSTSLSAETFYNKCLTGALTEDDYELSFHGRDPKFSKGSIRQKILTIPLLPTQAPSDLSPSGEYFCARYFSGTSLVPPN